MSLHNMITASEGLSFITGSDISADYSHDELAGGTQYAPDAVFEAADTQDVSRLLAACSAAGVPVTVRGAGTGKVGGSVAIHGGVVLSLKNMNKVLSFDETQKTVTVQPGVLLQDVKAEAEAHGLCYPPDPGEKTATVGGNASTNASGPSALKYGTTKDYIVDAELVLADGSVVRLSSKPEYSYALGSEGTIGVITELTLRFVDKPAADVILLLPFVDSESCVNAALRLCEFSPAILEYLDTDIVEFSGKVTGSPVFPVEMDGQRVGATLMLTLEGENEDVLDEQMEAVAELAEELECLDILVVDTPSLKRDVWAAHDAFHTAMETAAHESEINVNVPSQNIAAFINYAKELGSSACQIMAYAHIGSGGVHLHIISETGADMEKISELIYAKCAEFNGDIVGEYGVGYTKKAYLSREKRSGFKAKKAEFDPKGILNPGKVAD